MAIAAVTMREVGRKEKAICPFFVAGRWGEENKRESGRKVELSKVSFVPPSLLLCRRSGRRFFF